MLLVIFTFSMTISAQEDETLITNILIVDGTDSEPYSGSILIKGDVIASIFQGSSNDLDHHNLVDGMGMVLAPGFLDSHSHFDQGLEAQPYACLLYTSPSPRDRQKSRMPSSA